MSDLSFRNYERFTLCLPEQPDFDFTDEWERDYWTMYRDIVETLGELTVIRSQQEDDGEFYQAYFEIPLVIEELEDED